MLDCKCCRVCKGVTKVHVKELVEKLKRKLDPYNNSVIESEGDQWWWIMQQIDEVFGPAYSSEDYFMRRQNTDKQDVKRVQT